MQVPLFASQLLVLLAAVMFVHVVGAADAAIVLLLIAVTRPVESIVKVADTVALP